MSNMRPVETFAIIATFENGDFYGFENTEEAKKRWQPVDDGFDIFCVLSSEVMLERLAEARKAKCKKVAAHAVILGPQITEGALKDLEQMHREALNDQDKEALNDLISRTGMTEEDLALIKKVMSAS